MKPCLLSMGGMMRFYYWGSLPRCRFSAFVEVSMNIQFVG